MSALPLTLTTAGRAALINAQNTGVSNVVITEMGLSNVQVALSAATVAIPGEFKRVPGVGGQVVAPETFYVAATDTSADTYSVRTIALYLSNGVLLGAYSQAAVLLEKAEPAMAVIEASVRLIEPLAAEIEFTGGGWNNPPASETVEGIVRLATWAEVQAGTNDKRPVTPKWLKALLEGFSTTNHTHDASATVSGVFALARIPDLAMARITGLVDALAAKAAAVHTHAMADIVGLTAALGLKLDGALFTWANLPGKPAVAVSNTDVVFNSVQTVVAGAPATGRIYLGNQTGGSRTLIYDGTSYFLSGADLYVNGSKVWTAATFNPATKADAAHTQDWSTVTGKPTHILAAQAAVTGATDWNTVTTAGVYDVSPLGAWHANNPVNAYGYGQLTVSRGAASSILQSYFAHNNDTWSRQSFNGGWSAWKREWDSVSFDPTTKATLGATVSFWSVQAVEGGVGGRIILGNQSGGVRELVYNGVNYYLNGADLVANGSKVWTAATLNPATAATANAVALRDGSGNLTVRDLFATRGTSQGYVMLGDQSGGGRWLGYDGANYTLANASLAVNGSVVWTAATLNPTPATAAQFRANSSAQPLNPTGVWSAAALVAAAQAATIAVDLSAGLNFSTTMTGNRTLGAPANAKPGQSGVIQIIQDATGSRTLAFDAAWKFEGGTVPTLSAAANARDVLVFTVIAAGDVVASLLKDVRR